MSILQLLEDQIADCKITELGRSKEKMHGYMWDGLMVLTLKNGVICHLKMWYHFMSDDGGKDWKPATHSTEEYNMAWQLEFISMNPDTPKQLVHAIWYSIWIEKHLYISKICFIGEPNGFRENLRQQILNGTYDRTKVWQLF